MCALDRPETSPERLADCLERVALVRADLRDAKAVNALLQEFKPECAIHLAW